MTQRACTHVRAYKCRFYPTQAQENLLRRTMGCVRLVYNKALATKTEAWYERQERVDYKQTSSLLTGWKKTEDLAFLNEVSCVPLQQCLRHLYKAFANFWGKRAKYPRFKAKRNGGSAEFTKSAFKYRDGNLWLAKCQEPLNIVWSRMLPNGCSPSPRPICTAGLCDCRCWPVLQFLWARLAAHNHPLDCQWSVVRCQSPPPALPPFLQKAQLPLRLQS